MIQPNLSNYFRFRCQKGLEARGLLDREEYLKRLDYEAGHLNRAGFEGYLLIVADFVRWARENGIRVGPGRGSAAGSLCVYSLGITQLDPIQHRLIFERFYNPERLGGLPDVDLDFDQFQRDKVIDYVRQKYGPDHVAHIGTYGTMKSRGAIRDVARVLGLPYETGNRLASLTLPPVLGKPPKLKECYEKVPELRRLRDQEGSPEATVLSLAEGLEGKIRSFGTHASGVVISQRPLIEDVPLAEDKDGKAVTQFDMHSIEDIGLIKFDFLGLTTLAVIEEALHLIGKQIDLDSLPLDDETTFELLRSGHTPGIFQLEASAGIKDLVVQIAPTCFEDLIATVSIYRPGPLGSEHLAKYLSCRRGDTKPEYLIPQLEPILKSTSGWMILQEQALEIAVQIAGYTMGEADLLRHAIGKKKSEEMEAQEAKFKAGALANGYSQAIADKLWEDINYFSGYSFNRAHAACYAMIMYQTAWLKAHYPAQLMCAAMSCNMSNQDQMVTYLSECRRMGIPVLPPDINESLAGFRVTQDGRAIRFGLSAIKNLGDSPVQHIIEQRATAPYTGLLDFAERVDLASINKKKMESLVLSGCFDSSGADRAALLAGIDSVLRHKEEKKRYEAKLTTYKKRMLAYTGREQEILEAQMVGGKVPQPLKRPSSPPEPLAPGVPERDPLPHKEILSHERELLGFFISGHPLNGIASPLPYNIETIKDLPNGAQVSFLAVAATVREITTKGEKKKMAFVLFEDTSGTIEGALFPKVYATSGALLSPVEPVVVSGVVEVAESDTSRSVKVRVNRVSPPSFRPSQAKTSQGTIEVDLTPEGIHSLLREFPKPGVTAIRLKLPHRRTYFTAEVCPRGA